MTSVPADASGAQKPSARVQVIEIWYVFPLLLLFPLLLITFQLCNMCLLSYYDFLLASLFGIHVITLFRQEDTDTGNPTVGLDIQE